MADRNKKNREMGRFLFKWKEPKNKKVMKGAVNYLNMHVQRQESKYVISLVPVNEWLKDTMQSKTELSVWNMSSGQLVRSCSCTGNLFLLQFLLPPLEHLKFCQWWHKLKKITECCGLSHHDQKNSLHTPMQCSIVQCRFCVSSVAAHKVKSVHDDTGTLENVQNHCHLRSMIHLVQSLSHLFFLSVVPLLGIFPLFIYSFKTKGSIENKRMLEPRLKVLFESSIHLTLRLV